MSVADQPAATSEGATPPSRLSRFGPRVKVFAAPADTPRARRATDLFNLVGSALAVMVLAGISSPPAGFLKALDALLLSLPRFLDGLWQLVVDGLALYALGIIVLTVVRRRWPLLVDIALTAVVALALALAVGRLVEGSWPEAWEALRASAPPAWFPAQRLALAGAILLVANPYLSLPMRRLSRRLLALSVLATAALGVSTLAGATAGILLASVASGLVHVALGSSAGRPSLDQIGAALAELGVRPSDLSAARRQTAGLFTVEGNDDTGPILVKVYGRDAYDTQMLASAWRTIWYRSDDADFALSRLHYVQHEAFLALLAAQNGIRTESVVTAGVTSHGDALLVLRPIGTPLADLASDRDHSSDRGLAVDLWRTVDRLHRAGICHGQIDPRRVTSIDGSVGLADFRSARVAPEPEQLLRDDAQALLTSVLAFGEEVALTVALDELGAERLGRVLPFLQHPALTPYQREQIRLLGIDLDDLRDATAVRAGVELPELRQLRRVTWRSLLTNGLMIVAFTVLVRAVSRLDVQVMVETLSDARWWWVVVAAVVAQLPRLTQSLSTLGACPIPLPLGPVYALQLAVSYINLAVPTTAARVAVTVRFFQRQGLPPGTALGVGALDGFSGFVIQMALLSSLLLFTSASLDLDLDLDLSGAGSLLLVIGLFIALAAAAVAARPSWRQGIVNAVGQFLREAATTLRGLRSPSRLGLLFGGNLATELLFVLSLGLFVRSMGYPIGFGELLLINLSVALLAGLAPVPGGIGVAEGGLAFGLVSAGMPEEAAFGTVILYRLATFYTPPIWGFCALKWLERQRHL